MFDRLLKTLFPSLTAEDAQPNYDYFERTRQNGERNKKKAATGNTGSLDIGPTLQEANVETGLPLPPVQGVNPQFYKYLFGNPENDTSHQELSLFVGQKLQEVMAKPDMFLDALPAILVSRPTKAYQVAGSSL